VRPAPPALAHAASDCTAGHLRQRGISVDRLVWSRPLLWYGVPKDAPRCGSSSCATLTANSPFGSPAPRPLGPEPNELGAPACRCLTKQRFQLQVSRLEGFESGMPAVRMAFDTTEKIAETSDVLADARSQDRGMRIELWLDCVEPLAGQARMWLEPGEGPSSGEACPTWARPVAFVGWLGLLRVLDDLVRVSVNDSR